MTVKHPFILVALILPVLFSCINTRKATYFNDVPDSSIPYTAENLEPVIQRNDLLSISVSSLNPEATQIFNLPNTVSTQSSATAGSLSLASGYLVDQDGNILFPMLGSIKAAGLSKKELKEDIAKGITEKKLLIDPVVTIRYLNYKVTVLGEVAHPSVLTVPSEKISLLEAIGLAGDLTLYARRDDVMIIRDEEGKRITKHLNLTDKDIFTSPYYNLKSNDIVYIAPNKARVASATRTTQWLPVVFSALSVAFIVIDRLVK